MDSGKKMPGTYCADCSCDSKEQPCYICRKGGMRCPGTCDCCKEYRAKGLPSSTAQTDVARVFDTTEYIPNADRASITGTEHSPLAAGLQTNSQPEGSAENLPSTSSSHATGTAGISASSGDIIRRLPSYEEICGVQIARPFLQERLFLKINGHFKEILRHVPFFHAGELYLLMCGSYFKKNICRRCRGVINWTEHWKYYNYGVCVCDDPERVNENSLRTLPPNTDISTLGSSVEVMKPRRVIYNNGNTEISLPNNEYEPTECAPIQYTPDIRCHKCTRLDPPCNQGTETIQFTCCICKKPVHVPFITGEVPTGAPPLSSAAGPSTSAEADRRQYTASEPVRGKLPPSSRDPPSTDEVDITEYIENAHHASITVSAAEYASLPAELQTSRQPEGSAENLPSTSSSHPTETAGTSAYSNPVIRHLPSELELFEKQGERLFQDINDSSQGLEEIPRYLYYFSRGELLFVSCNRFFSSKFCRKCSGTKDSKFLLHGWDGKICSCRSPQLTDPDSLHTLPPNRPVGPRVASVLRPQRLKIESGRIEVLKPGNEYENTECTPITYTPNIRCHKCTRHYRRPLSSEESKLFTCCVCHGEARVPLIEEPDSPSSGENSPDTSMDTWYEKIQRILDPPYCSHCDCKRAGDKCDRCKAKKCLGKCFCCSDTTDNSYMSSQSSAPVSNVYNRRSAGSNERCFWGTYEAKVFQGRKGDILELKLSNSSNFPINFPLIGRRARPEDTRNDIRGPRGLELSTVPSGLELCLTIPCPGGEQEELNQTVSDIQIPEQRVETSTQEDPTAARKSEMPADEECSSGKHGDPNMSNVVQPTSSKKASTRDRRSSAGNIAGTSTGEGTSETRTGMSGDKKDSSSGKHGDPNMSNVVQPTSPKKYSTRARRSNVPSTITSGKSSSDDFAIWKQPEEKSFTLTIPTADIEAFRDEFRELRLQSFRKAVAGRGSSGRRRQQNLSNVNQQTSAQGSTSSADTSSPAKRARTSKEGRTSSVTTKGISGDAVNCNKKKVGVTTRSQSRRKLELPQRLTVSLRRCDELPSGGGAVPDQPGSVQRSSVDEEPLVRAGFLLRNMPSSSTSGPSSSNASVSSGQHGDPNLSDVAQETFAAVSPTSSESLNLPSTITSGTSSSDDFGISKQPEEKSTTLTQIRAEIEALSDEFLELMSHTFQSFGEEVYIGGSADGRRQQNLSNVNQQTSAQGSTSSADTSNVPSTSTPGPSSRNVSGRYCEICNCKGSDDLCDMCIRNRCPCHGCK